MISEELLSKGKAAREAAYILAEAPTELKNRALLRMAEALLRYKTSIIAANKIDMDNARAAKMSTALLDRLLLTEDRIDDMAEGLVQLADLEDPIGRYESMWYNEDGLQIGKVAVPLGVIGIIYEARPNVAADAAGLCLKSGNAVLLRGGSDAEHSNRALTEVLSAAVSEVGLPAAVVQSLDDTSRETATQLMQLNEYLNVLIPRGGADLIRTVTKNATVPVIETGTGNCHIYVDKAADAEKTLNIVANAKLQRPGVCNAVETLLVHRDRAEEILPLVGKKLREESVELRGCAETRKVLPWVVEATEEDYHKEYLDLVLAVKVVADYAEAVEHIREYGTGHSEAIISEDYGAARNFLRGVDAAAVYVNASTRFTDGFKFGFGAEIGISTQKMQARGPMGLKALTSYKYVIMGEGQVRP